MISDHHPYHSPVVVIRDPLLLIWSKSSDTQLRTSSGRPGSVPFEFPWITCSWFDYVSQGRSSDPYISQGTRLRQCFRTKSRNLLHMPTLQNQKVRLPSDQNQTISTSPKVPKPNHLNISQGTKTNPSQHLPSSRNQTISTSPK